MTTTPPNSSPAEKTEASPSFEDQVKAIWEKKENRNAVYVGCAVVALVIIGWYGYKALAAQREAEIEAAYAAAVTPARLRAFAQENTGHPLAGAAYLKQADEAYSAGSFTEAIASYDKAIATLPGTPFAARAILGKGICLIQSGKQAEGLAVLRQIADDVNQIKVLRAEAAYHLATVSFDAGKFDDVAKLTELVLQNDASGMWSQRALLLRAHTPVPAAAPAAAPAKQGASVKLPGS